ncbi:hypothetical protein PF008_g9295 [Phytophthora fragariae]|uniref:Uncharacterized protein n=1 Tax=Phytophthora fragariae TaxID=53985 RepID=A0A6G0RX64_9STRA|nr:hypothetical protein PF008_g9295 [Phytophthora fragariae]
MFFGSLLSLATSLHVERVDASDNLSVVETRFDTVGREAAAGRVRALLFGPLGMLAAARVDDGTHAFAFLPMACSFTRAHQSFVSCCCAPNSASFEAAS